MGGCACLMDATNSTPMSRSANLQIILPYQLSALLKSTLKVNYLR